MAQQDPAWAEGAAVGYRCHDAGDVQPLDQALASFDRIRAPTELRVYENEFHPLG
jgi:hypothetical protein